MSMYNLVTQIENLVSEIATDTPSVTRDVNLVKIDGTATSVNTGAMTEGTLRVTVATDDPNLSAVATNTADCKTDLDALYNCIDHVNSHLEVDTNAINGVLTSVNAGVNDNGVQRMCVSTDDVNLSAINTSTANMSTILSGTLPVSLDQLRGVTLDVSNGVYSTGTQRMVICDNDPNLSVMQTNLSNLAGLIPGGFPCNLYMSGNPADIGTNNVGIATPRVTIANDDFNLSQLVTILNDVWDSTNHYLRVHTIP